MIPLTKQSYKALIPYINPLGGGVEVVKLDKDTGLPYEYKFTVNPTCGY